MTTWLLCDYGEVLSRPQDPALTARLMELSGVRETEWPATYWRHRLAYDRGSLDAAGYWAATLGAPVGAELLASLVDADVRSWLQHDPDAVEAVARAADRGMLPALLSNAPHDVADAVDRLPWLAGFEPRIYSARLGMTKPDPAIYEAALDELEAEPGDVWFVDDREVNVAAAAAAGLHAAHYRGDPALFDSLG